MTQPDKAALIPTPELVKARDALKAMLALFDDEGNMIATFVEMQDAIADGYEILNQTRPSYNIIAQPDKAALVKRISAALADGKDSGGYDTLFDMHAHIALSVIEQSDVISISVRLEARPADDSEDWTEIFPVQLEWVARNGHQVRAIEIEQRSADGLREALENLPKPETMLIYASILEKPKYDDRGVRLATGEIVEAACSALRYCAALRADGMREALSPCTQAELDAWETEKHTKIGQLLLGWYERALKAEAALAAPSAKDKS